MNDLNKDRKDEQDLTHLREGEEVSLNIPAPEPRPHAKIIKRQGNYRKHQPINEDDEIINSHINNRKYHNRDKNIAPHASGDFIQHKNKIDTELIESTVNSHKQLKINLMPEQHRKNIPRQNLSRLKRISTKISSIRSHKHWQNIKLVVGTVLVFALVFNSQWFISQIMYLFNRPSSQQKTENQIPSNTSAEVAEPSEPAQAEIVGPENLIIIPKINVTAPLVFPSTSKESDVLIALRDGVVHYYGTAYPGEKGNAAFFGHSSNDWWEPGNYKFVFVILEKLSAGDTYEIHYNSRKYVYQVVETKVVEATDLSVLNQTNEPFSTLITCTPPGTSWRRFVVVAKQISPNPKKDEAKEAEVKPIQTNTQQLPSAAPSIWQQINSFFSNLLGKKTDLQPANENQATQAPTEIKHLPEVN